MNSDSKLALLLKYSLNKNLKQKQTKKNKPKKHTPKQRQGSAFSVKRYEVQAQLFGTILCFHETNYI